jgi:hypothetical protein
MKLRGEGGRLWQVDIAEEVKIAYKIQAHNSVTKRPILRPTRTLGGNNQLIITTILHYGWDSYDSGQDLFCALKYANRPGLIQRDESLEHPSDCQHASLELPYRSSTATIPR